MSIGVVVGLATGLLTCCVTEIYCHRCLAHHALRLHPRLASFLDGFMQVFGGVHPRRWVAIHRMHHRYADTPLDPHSPLQRHPLLVLVGTPYLFVRAVRQLPAGTPSVGARAHAARAAIGLFWLVAIGPAQAIVATAVYLACYLGIMGMVNTFGHSSGAKPHPDIPGHDSALLALLLLGHGYHNSHHAHPAAARMGLLDPMWPIVRLLAAGRLVTLDEPRAQASAGGCCRAGAWVRQPISR